MSFEAQLSILATIAVTILGFILTASAILVTVLDKPFISNLIKTGHLKVVWLEICRAGGWLIAVLVVLILSTLMPAEATRFTLPAIFGLIALAFIELVAGANKFMKIITRL